MHSQEYVNVKLIHLAKFWANLGLQHPTEKSAMDIVACAVLTEQEAVIVGPMGVYYFRIFRGQSQETVVQLRANHMEPQAPDVYTGRVLELQKKEPLRVVQRSIQ